MASYILEILEGEGLFSIVNKAIDKVEVELGEEDSQVTISLRADGRFVQAVSHYVKGGIASHDETYNYLIDTIYRNVHGMLTDNPYSGVDEIEIEFE